MTDDTMGDGASTDESISLNLEPRSVEPRGPRRRRLLPAALLAVVIAALGFVLLQTLGDASLFFYNADDAVAQRDDLTDQRFRVQGMPFGDPVSTEIEREGRLEPAVVFPIRFADEVIDVVHVGSPAELFQPGVPVVLEGQWVRGFPAGAEPIVDGADDGWHFASTDMVVKHDNEYRTDNEERLDEADRGGFAPET